MGSVINTNINSVIAQRNLNVSAAALAKSTEKLSSGLRINRAGDDAAGLAISQKLEAQVRGLQQASRNAQDAISMIQTAEGAMSEIHSMLQRMRELSVQASNGTLSSSDRSSINTEIQALSTEINDLTGRIKFNGQTLLNGSLATSVDATSELKNSTALAVVAGDLFTVSTVDVVGAAAGTTYTLSAGTGAADVTLTATVNGSTIAQTLTASDMTGANASQLLNYDKLGVKITVATVAANANWNSANDEWNLNANELDEWHEGNLVFSRCNAFLPRSSGEF